MKRFLSFVPALFCIVFLMTPSAALAQESEPTMVRHGGNYLFTKPGGAKTARMMKNAKIKVLKTHGDWVKVSVVGWMEKAATDYKKAATSKKPKARKKLTLSLEDFSMETISKYDTGDEGRLKLTLQIKNNTKREIKKWDAMMFVVLKRTGTVLQRIGLSGKDPVIAPGAVEVFNFYWKESEDLYAKLQEFPKKQISMRFTKVDLLK